ncbi:MAG: flagellar hook-basal body complex protein [Planctomycetota bacterium]
MGLQSALTTSLTGLQAAETIIDVVGNNIANSNTVGFKESNTIFATQFLQTVSIGSAPSTNSGGTNPRQIGLGVRVSQISPDFTQGTIEISSNPLDVAIQGDGFLIVQNGTDRLYTRNGQLQLNAENDVVTSTGQRLLGYTVDEDFDLLTDNLVPLSIDLGAERVAQATSTASFTGVLNPSVDIGSTPSISQSIVLGDGTISQPPIDAGQTLDGADLLEADEPVLVGTAAASTGVGTGPGAGVVSYRVTFLDANGQESAPSAEFSVTNAGGTVNLTGIPQGSGPWTQRRIYRTQPDGTEFRLVTTIANNTDTTLSDTSADGTVGAAATLNNDLIEPGSYSYYVTFYDPVNQVETRPTAQIGSQALTTPGGRIRLDLDDLASPADPAFTQLRVYRSTLSDSSVFRRVDTDSAPIAVTATSYVDSTPDSVLTDAVTPRAQVNLDGPPAGAGNRLVDLVVRNGTSYLENFFEAGTLTFTAEKDGVALEPKTLTITGDPTVPGGAGTTVQELIDFIREAAGIDTESDVTGTENAFPTAGNVQIVNGQIVITSNLGEENAVNVPLTAFRLQPTGSATSSSLPISFSETQAANGPGTSTELTVFDSLGLPLKVRITTVLEETTSNSTIYRWFASSGDNEPLAGVSTVVGDGLLEFDSNGDLVAASQDRISVQRNTTASASPLEVQLDFSLIKSLGETDANNNPISSLNFASQDGFPPGVLTDFIITDDGLIQGQFSNGTQRTVGQIVMARFANAAGLQQVGDSLFNIGVNSGEAITGTPGNEGIGTLTAGAVELSNTDIGQNLIELILASTQYRGGSRVITTAQELLDELLALRR